MLRYYELYFERRLAQLQAGTLEISGEMLENLASIMNDVVKTIPEDWRSDARFFLAENVSVMVVQPYLSAFHHIEQGAPDVDGMSAFRELLFIDLDKIIGRSRSVAAERNRPYVSASSVTVALADLVEDLGTISLRIWGPRRDG